VVVTEGLRRRAADPPGNLVGTDMPPELERVEVTVASESDHRGLVGLDGVSPGRFGLRALVDWAERHSPVTAAARRPLPVTVEPETGSRRPRRTAASRRRCP
jgi:hypothetical protein